MSAKRAPETWCCPAPTVRSFSGHGIALQVSLKQPRSSRPDELGAMRGTALSLCVLAALLLQANAQFGDIGNFFSNVGNTISNTANNVVGDVSNVADSVGNDVKNAANTSVNAVKSGFGTVEHTASHIVDTGVSFASNTTNTVTHAVVNFTQNQWNSAANVADNVGSAVSSFTGTAVNVGREAGGDIKDVGNVVHADSPVPSNATDATEPGAIEAALSGAQGFKPVTVGILQAIKAGRSANVEAAFASVVESANATSNQTMQVQIAEAWTTAMAVAQNNTDTGTNATQVAEVFLASLQDAVVPCQSSLKPNARPGTEAYATAVADACCPGIDKTLSTAAMVSDLLKIDDAFYAALQVSDTLGSQPQINLGQCLADTSTE
ncbi:hypothetical protein WJX73_001788 [Symbiochloris irregularis]|uniref:Uncharacterized protein n=1 Tax=Symbiochloris irregularis TaxID=706552 RepID=A0AAW1PRH3_9CHLO